MYFSQRPQSAGVRRAAAGGADRLAVPLLRFWLPRGAPQPRPRPPREGLPSPPDQVPAPRLSSFHVAHQERNTDSFWIRSDLIKLKPDIIKLMIQCVPEKNELIRWTYDVPNITGLPCTPPSASTAQPTVRWKAATPRSSTRTSADTSSKRTSALPRCVTSSNSSREAGSSALFNTDFCKFVVPKLRDLAPYTRSCNE